MPSINSLRKHWRLLAASVLLISGTRALHAEGAGCDAAYLQLQTTLETFTNLCYAGGLGFPSFVCDDIYFDVNNAHNTGLENCTEMRVWPKGKLLSILYMPPGDRSSVGYSSSSTSGTNWSLEESFSSNSNTSLSFSLYGASLGANIGVSRDYGVSEASSTTLTNTLATTWATSGNPIDHTQDILTIWLNPQVTVVRYPCALALGQRWGSQPITCDPPVFFSTEGNAAYDTTTHAPVNGDAIAAGDMSTISVKVAALQNPTTLLPSQLVSRTSSDGTVVAGLLSLCATPIPEPQCTATAAASNACGCTAADFAPLVQQDPFFNPNTGTHTVGAINGADPNNARFVPVKDASGNNLGLVIQAGVTQSFSLRDDHNQSVTYSHKVSETYGATVGYSAHANVASFDLKHSDSFTYSARESMGSTQGSSHTQQLTLATSNPACFEFVNIYEDTLFHTFVFENGSAAPNPCP